MKANINQLLNLKISIIKSLKKQGYADNFTYPTLRNLNLHKKNTFFKINKQRGRKPPLKKILWQIQ